jgi:carbon monoxide dehydrogenase subunit G
MDMTGSQRIEATREIVYAALNDVEVLRQCIPGCETVEKTSDTEMSAKVTLKIGPVKASFSGKVTLSDLDPPNGYTISGEGSGGAAGFAKGGAKVSLEADGDATILHYTVDAQIGGKLAQLGGRLIDATAKKLAGDFFEKFSDVVAPAPAEPAETGQNEPKKKGWIGKLIG